MSGVEQAETGGRNRRFGPGYYLLTRGGGEGAFGALGPGRPPHPTTRKIVCRGKTKFIKAGNVRPLFNLFLASDPPPPPGAG